MNRSTTFLQVGAMALALLWATEARAQRVTIPEGTVIELRMETGLNSGSSEVGDTFKASVLRTLWIDGRAVIPANSSIDGRVTTVEPAERSSRSGVIGVVFNRLSIDGRSYSIEGALTSLRADERKQIIDEESRIEGESTTQRNILFIGGAAGAGAVIGAIAGGKKGAGIGVLTGGGIGALGALLSRGSEAQVPVGSEIAMQLVLPVTVTADSRLRQGAPDDRTLYTAAEMVRGAQTSLRQRNYYEGAINGRLDDATRRSIAHYQIDNNQPATGDLDLATAASLGLVRTGSDAHSVTNADSRQLAADIHRKASSLLDSYENTLGVNVDNVRSKPQLSEADMDLLLHVLAFERAATWYEQTSKAGENGEAAFDNAGRILLRSTLRVETAMKAGFQDRRFHDAWSSLQNDLRQIMLDASTARQQ